MSYDLYFLERRPGRSWEDAFDALEGGAGGRTFGPAEKQTWDAVEAAVRPLIPDAELFADDEHRELSDVATGLQLMLFPGELSLSVPYWHRGDEAERMTQTLQAVARAVEDATGLVAFDPQANEPFLGGGDATAAKTLGDIHDFTRGIGAGEPAREKRQPFWRRLFGSGP